MGHADESLAASKYELTRWIAVGGMDVVYAAVPRVGRDRTPVAIERPHRRVLGDRAARAEILAEARNGSLVRHPNVVGRERRGGDDDALPPCPPRARPTVPALTAARPSIRHGAFRVPALAART